MTEMPFAPIDPDLAPGGLVFRICEDDGETVLREHFAHLDDGRAELIAREDAAYVMDLLERGVYQTIWLVTYDGDTGRCVAALKHSRVPDPSAN